MNKHTLSERDICAMFIAPALQRSGWDPVQQIREEVSCTKVRIILRDKAKTAVAEVRAKLYKQLETALPRQ